jgi:hypothetical protein
MRKCSPADGMLKSALADVDYDDLQTKASLSNAFGINYNAIKFWSIQPGIDSDSIAAMHTTDNAMPPHKMVMLPNVALRLRSADIDKGK